MTQRLVYCCIRGLYRTYEELKRDEITVEYLMSLSGLYRTYEELKLQKTFYVRFRATKTVSPHDNHPFDELDDYGVDHRLKEVLLKNLPIEDVKINSIHSKINHELGNGQFVDIKTIFETLDLMAIQGEIKKESSIMGVRYKKL